MSSPSIGKAQQIREIMKCASDPHYFINKYIKIQHPTKGTLSFVTYPFQDDVIDALHKHRFNVIVKSRQLGISTVTAAFALWLALFHRDKNILCIATKLKTAQNFIQKVKHAFNALPAWLVLKPKTGDSKQHISWANGCQIKAIPKSGDAGRSEAVSFLIVDEAAHIEGFDELWVSLLPTLSEGGSACMLSSPKGAMGVFHRTYIDAVAGVNNWNHIQLKWDVHPERDLVWLEAQKKLFSEQQFNQEYMCEFLRSGNTYISPTDIEFLKSIVRAPLRRDGPMSQIWVWADAISDHKYVVSADVARGDQSGDYSTFHIFDNTEGEVVAEYMGHIRPDDFGKLLDIWGRKYNNALMCPELNTYGHHVVTVLNIRDYPNMYYEERERNPAFYPGPDDHAGFKMMGKGKRDSVLARMEEVIRNRIIRIYSQRFLDQIITFVDGTKIAARRGSHDDLIMSFAIGARIIDVAAIDESARQIAYALLNATSRTDGHQIDVMGNGMPRSNEYSHALAVFNRNMVIDRKRYGNTVPNVDPQQTNNKLERMRRISWLLN